MSLRRSNEISEFESCIKKTREAMDQLELKLRELEEKGVASNPTGELHHIANKIHSDLLNAAYPWLSFMNRD